MLFKYFLNYSGFKLITFQIQDYLSELVSTVCNSTKLFVIPQLLH